MQSSTLLSAVVFLPLLGAILLLLVPRGEKALLRGSAFTISLFVFIISLFLWTGFDPNGPSFQFESDPTVDNETWIGAIGASYHIGIDGVSLTLEAAACTPAPGVKRIAPDDSSRLLRTFVCTRVPGSPASPPAGSGPV